jgi:predicted nucleic acid-binding protein
VNYLVDTNILLRLIESRSPHHAEAKNAVDKLLKNGDTLFLTLQNISEFWKVCMHTKDKNGLGFSITKTDVEFSTVEKVFDLLLGTMEVYKN